MANGFKKCQNCDEKKSLKESFHRDSTRKDGFHPYCKLCRKGYSEKYYSENKEKINKKHKEYYLNNKEKILRRKKEYYLNNKEEILRKQKKQSKKYYKENKEKIIEKSVKYKKERYNNDSEYRLKRCVSSRIKKAIKRNSKSKRTKELLGCSIKEFKEYLEKQFDDKMTWNNYGTYWHIDHIVPLSSFNLEKSYHQKEAFYYTNCQPLEASKNLQKSNKIK